jgi:ATP-dependent Clp protease ATP-binding subunit ClpC
VIAQGEARTLNHGEIGTGHLLLGLIAEEEGIAAKALESLGVSLSSARNQVEGMVEPAPIAPPESPLFTARVKKVMELSFREAFHLGHSYIATEHLLLGLVSEGEGVGAQALQGMGVDLERVRRQVLLLLSGYHDKESGSMTPTSKSPIAPRCTGCHADLVDVARYRSIVIPPNAPDPFPMPVEGVYCNECGYVLSMFKASS